MTTGTLYLVAPLGPDGPLGPDRRSSRGARPTVMTRPGARPGQGPDLGPDLQGPDRR